MHEAASLMFCGSCGIEQTDDSKFCRKCGRALVPTPATAATPKTKKSNRVLWWIFGIIVAWALAIAIGKNAWRLTQPSQHTFQQPTRIMQTYTAEITNTSFTIKNLTYSYFQFTVPADSTNVSVTGHFSATGGSGNDVEVYLLGADDFVNWQNGHEAKTFYNSGRLTQSTITAGLPGEGSYYLIFDNRFSLISPKAVQANATLNYSR